MTHDREIERILDRWFSDGPDQVPDRVINMVADRIEGQRQRPAWRLDRRLHPVNTYTKFAVATAAVLVMAIGGLLLLRPSSPSVAGPGPTPSAIATSTPTASPTSVPTPFACEDNVRLCAGPLAAGPRHASYFDPRLYFRIPDGWVNSVDLGTLYKLDPADGASPSILVWSNASIANQTASCDPIAKPHAGLTARDWITFVTTHPGLVASKPVPVDLDGSKGQALDVSLSPDWKTTCPTHGGQPYVMILRNSLGGEYGVGPDQRLHLVVVDNVSPSCDPTQKAACAKTVVIEVYGPSDPGDFATATAAARSIIESFSFGCGPAFGRGPCALGT